MKLKKNTLLIIINIAIIILEIIGFVISVNEMGRPGYEYYTEESNFLLLVSSTISLFFLVDKKRKSKRWVDVFKFTSLVSVTITLLVVLIVLAPSIKNGYQSMLLNGSMLYHHLLCPLLAIISFLFFDDYLIMNKKEIRYSLIYTILYSIVTVILNIAKVLNGPYFFLLVYENPIYISIIWMLAILGSALGISVGLNYLKKKVKK